MRHENLLGDTPAAYLPEHEEASSALRSGADPASVAARFPSCCAAWAALAERAMADGEPVAAYAYGPVPWEHEPNQGFLRALHMLGEAATAIGEQDEAERCREFLRDSSQTAAAVLREA